METENIISIPLYTCLSSFPKLSFLMNKRNVLQLKITYTIHRLSNISNIFFLAPPPLCWLLCLLSNTWKLNFPRELGKLEWCGFPVSNTGDIKIFRHQTNSWEYTFIWVSLLMCLKLSKILLWVSLSKLLLWVGTHFSSHSQRLSSSTWMLLSHQNLLKACNPETDLFHKQDRVK